MEIEERKKYARLIYAQVFRLLGICLVMSAVVSGVLNEKIYFIWAMATSGVILIAFAWFTYLQMCGVRLPFHSRKKQYMKVPYCHQRYKACRPHVPSFLKDATYFDDDLSDATVVDRERFSHKERSIAQIISSIMCAVILILLSISIRF